MSQAPQDLERTDEQPKSSYVSRKDIKVVAISLVVLAVVLSPVYFVLRENRDAFVCKRNIQAISKAISLYATENNDRLPPVFVTADGVTPFVEEDGGIYTWAYLVKPYMKADASFVCPKASEEECYLDHDAETGALMPVSYGMYLPMGGMPISSVSNPESAILVAETFSLGARDSYNPHPFLDENGKPVRDGFAVTWDTGNVPPAPGAKITAVTRLAYPESKAGVFKKEGASRHPEGNHYITVSGSAATLKPDAAKVEWDTRQRKITGRWAIPE